MRESHIERAVGEFCKKHGITYQKMTSPAQRGVADRLVMLRGKAIFLELKAPGGKPTALQERYLKLRKADGFAAEWHDSIEGAINFITKELL
jgi:hypothetical protein